MKIVVLIGLSLIIAFILKNIFSAKRLKKIDVEESNYIINLDENNFQETTKGTVALIDFWAEWCMPCKMMAPVLNEVANEVGGNVKICKINVDKQQALASRFSVRSIPTLVLLKNGKEIDRFVGIKPKDFLLKQINEANN